MDASVAFLGRNASIMALVKQQLTSVGYAAEGYMRDDELLARMERGAIALLVLGGGVEDNSREVFRKICMEKNIPLLEHFGGPDQLLENVRTALGK